nr:uncharacterized protein LOC116432217 [Nomia melanderi]XP_031844633.1 uncharacterized protein LOC116432217 [Nomia melanderi]
MSETEDIRGVVEGNDFHSIIEEESGRSSSADYLDTYEDVHKGIKELSEESNGDDFREDRETFVEAVRRPLETERKEIIQPARATPETTPAPSSLSADDASSPGEDPADAAPPACDGERAGTSAAAEWNSLPVLVERLRTVLEHSLTSGSEQPARPVPEDSGVDSEEDQRLRNSMERVLVDCKGPELRKDLKFLEDLLLSDIQTALSRLRETLERIDVAALARNGAASDPSSKLHLLKLVSSLLSRLQVTEEPTEKPAVLPSTSLSRRRRGTRHTIGVSAEELAKARKWLEEERTGCSYVEDAPSKDKEQANEASLEKKPEEVRDKCVKDAINQRQVLEDKNKEIRESYKVAQPEDAKQSEGMIQYNYPESESAASNESDDRSRVSKLAAALRQRAELAGSRYPAANKFTAKKTKIKRANTIDIPSYLKLQAESLGRENSGCVSLRRPINVGDKAGLSPGTAVPTLQPKTENDRKFLALINRNEAPANAAAPYKPFGFAKMDASLANKNWNSRFSNIKTTFDKPTGNEDRENRPSLKDRANKMFPGTAQTQVYGAESDSRSYGSTVKDTGGFRHAPSSPFKKIEKSPVSPFKKTEKSAASSKVPPSYHWPKAAPVPTNTLKEKARMMFDKETPAKPRIEDQEKSAFPKPPWLEKTNGTITENGRIDYKSFCKQFAPFVGKSTVDARKFESQRLPGVVDGKISFKIPEKQSPRIHQQPDRRESAKEKFAPRSAFEAIKARAFENQKPRYPDATLRGSSSVAVQTGANEDQDEGRSFKVAPKISKGSTACSNASVQTTDLEKPRAANDADVNTNLESTVYHPDPQRFVLDHNQNYRTVPDALSPRQANDHRSVHQEASQSYQKQPGVADPRYEGFQRIEDHGNVEDHSFVSDDQPEVPEKADWPVEGSTFLDDQNIQNQDISSDTGVVTRYTCAIATVASSVDSPEPRSEEMLVDSRASSTPSPSQWSSRSRPATSETATPEDEIRRHNLLQQSLVRRLQNEITSLNDEPPHPSVSPSQFKHQPSSQPDNYANQFKPLTQPSSQPESYPGQQSFDQPSFSPPSVLPQAFNQLSNQNRPAPSHSGQAFNQPANFDRPPGPVASKYGKYLTPVPQKKPERAHSPGPVTANRVGALREAYELSPNSPPKPIQKERSPIPNGVAIDSSDEYLVSCANKPSRSIVLSKSESWHQLALSNSYPRAPKVNAPVATPSKLPSHPKPPKPRSPSSQKLRSKQFEASSMADSVKKMEDKIRQYFDSPAEPVDTKDHKNRRSPRMLQKTMVGLSRSRTMTGIPDERLRLVIPSEQAPLLNVNTADVDKVFDDLFEEATRNDVRHQC